MEPYAKLRAAVQIEPAEPTLLAAKKLRKEKGRPKRTLHLGDKEP